jgi:hypothetical protein
MEVKRERAIRMTSGSHRTAAPSVMEIREMGQAGPSAREEWAEMEYSGPGRGFLFFFLFSFLFFHSNYPTQFKFKFQFESKVCGEFVFI